MFLIQALYYAGIFLLYIDKADKAKEYVDRMLKIKPQSPEGIALKGWVEVDLKFSQYGYLQGINLKSLAQYKFKLKIISCYFS